MFLFLPLCHCTEGVKSYSDKVFTLLDTLPVFINLFLNTPPLLAGKPWKQQKHWVQLNSDPNKIKLFLSEGVCVTFCQRFRSAIWSTPRVKWGLPCDSSHQGQGAQGWWPIHMRNGALVANSSVRLLGQSPFGILRQNREDLGLCCTHFKMSTVSNASRQEVSVNRFFSFLPFASLQFLFQQQPGEIYQQST